MKYIYGEIVEDKEKLNQKNRPPCVGICFNYDGATHCFDFTRFILVALETVGGLGWQVTPYFNPLQNEVVYFTSFAYQDSDQVKGMLDELRKLSSSESVLE